MVDINTLNETTEELRQKHNQLCELLDNMKLNNLADFEALMVEDAEGSFDIGEDLTDEEEVIENPL